jgi:hypothetical protein
MMASEREAMAGSRSRMLTSIKQKIVKKVVRKKLPMKCGRYIIHETAHIQSVYIKSSTIVDEEDGVAPETETRFIGQERLNDNEALPTENGGGFTSNGIA